MRRLPSVVVAIILSVVACFLFKYLLQRPPSAASPPKQSQPAPVASSNALSVSTSPVTVVASVPISTNAPPPPRPRLEIPEYLTAKEPLADVSPMTVLENMRSAVHEYGRVFGGNPVGTNLEITEALLGRNPKQAQFLRPDSGLRINAKGELIDTWNTPYFFHQLSRTETEIRSAGPDHVMWTKDDLVIK